VTDAFCDPATEVDVTLTVFSERFSCPDCYLELEDLELIHAAGLPETFIAYGDESDVYFELEFGND